MAETAAVHKPKGAPMIDLEHSDAATQGRNRERKDSIAFTTSAG
jgi:hypothetical protein